MSAKYPGQGGRRPIEEVDGLKCFKDLSDQPHLRFATLQKWQKRNLQYMLAHQSSGTQTNGILYWIGAYQARPVQAARRHGGAKRHRIAEGFHTPLIPRISATATALEALWHTLSSFDSAREIEIYLRKTIIPDISWNARWDGIGSITAEEAWIGKAVGRSFEYQITCGRCSLPCTNVQMKDGKFMYTSRCGCTDDSCATTPQIGNVYTNARHRRCMYTVCCWCSSRISVLLHKIHVHRGWDIGGSSRCHCSPVATQTMQ